MRSPVRAPAAPRVRSSEYLIGAGIPEERAAAYDRGIREGGIVLGTRARDEAHAKELERDFTSYGGRDILR